jgi:hypothetical protein
MCGLCGVFLTETHWAEAPVSTESQQHTTITIPEIAVGSQQRQKFVYVVGPDGNQAYAFGVERVGDRLALHAQPEYFPMR